MEDDNSLIIRARRGDLEAFAALYDRYRRVVYRVSLTILRDSGIAEDVLQDTFLRLHAHLHDIDGSVPIGPWLHRVAVNLSYNVLSRRKRWLPIDEALDGLLLHWHPRPERMAENVELNQSVQAALDGLPFHHRVTVILFYLSGYSLEEIAYISECPVGTVKSRLHYARQKLREMLGEQAPVTLARKLEEASGRVG